MDEEQLKKKVASVQSALEPFIQQCSSVDDFESHIEEIKSIDGVENVYSEGKDFVIQIRDWFEIRFTNRQTPINFLPSLNSLPRKIVNRLMPISKEETPIDVTIGFQMETDTKWSDEKETIDDLCDDFKSMDYQPKLYLGKEMDMDFFYRHIFDSNVLIIETHGGCGIFNKKHYLYTGIEAKYAWVAMVGVAELRALGIDVNNIDLDDVGITCCSHDDGGWFGEKWYWMVKEDYIRKSPYRFTGAGPHIVFMGACSSLKGDDVLTRSDGVQPYGNDSFAQVFFNKGADVYLGYNRDVARSTGAGASFFDYMMHGASVEQAFKKLHPLYKYESDTEEKAFLVDLYKKDSKYKDPKGIFIVNTKTIEKTEQETLSEYKNTGQIELKGKTAVSLKDHGGLYDFLNYGFIIDTQPNSDDLENGEVVPAQYSDNQTGEVSFFTTYTPIPGQTYYYRAFTYDGIHCNWGEEKIFSIPGYDPLSLSTKSVSLKVGETSTIDITAGSGSYSIEKIEPEGVVSASISENHISIEALTGGTATITVKDDKSGETVPIEVKVEWDHLSFAINGTVDLKVGESTTIDITSGSGSYSIEEIKPAGVVTASVSENHISIEALKAGTATITVKDDKSGEKAPIEVKVQVKDIPAEAIDLGLPSGILWASYNIGATTPEEYGSYFAWGEIEDKDVYYWTTYSHCDGVSNSCHDIGADISGTRFDVAHMRWEGEWRMPTAEEFKELVYQCDYQVTTQNGVYGFKFTGPNGNSIFFPAAGYRFNTGINKAGSSGEYWSSTVRENKNYAYDTSMSADYVYWDCYINRFAGLPVRPVKQAAPALEDLVLSTTSPISLKAGETYTVQIISGNGVYSIYDNTAPNVVSASISENNVIIEALTAGTATITIKDNKSGDTAPIEVTVTGGTEPVSYLTCPDDHHPHMIDLGLPSGTKWACCNVGADTPEGFGDYFAWGETEEKSEYSRETYRYCNFTNRRWHWENLGSDIAGTDYDAATANWGAPWRMPTLEQIDELLNDCTVEKTTKNEVNGLKFVGPSGRSIFLPDAGYKLDEDLSWHRAESGIWSSTYSGRADEFATFLGFESARYYDSRCKGRSVRPVQ